MGVTVKGEESGAPLLEVDFNNIIEGRPGTLHGGAITGLLETAGYAVLRQRLVKEERSAQLKPINVTVQFLSAGKRKPIFAVGRINRLGRRNANITVEAWQDDRQKPIATAVMNIMMQNSEDEGD